MIVVLLSILVILLNGQISPTWLESAYAETKTVLIVDNHQKTTGAFYQNSTYTKPLTSPHVCLCNYILMQRSSN